MVKPLYIVSLYYDSGRVTGANKRFDEIGRRMLKVYGGPCTIIAQLGHRPSWCPQHQFIGIRPYAGKLSRLISWAHLSLVLLRVRSGIVYNDFQPAPLFSGLRHRRLQLIHDLRNWTEFGRGGLGALSTLFQKQQLGSAFAVVTVSEASKRDIVEKCGIAPEKVVVSYNGIDDSYQVNPGIQRDIDLCYVATFEPRKNHLRLLKAVEELPDVRSLVLIGRDLGTRAELEAYIAASETLAARGVRIIESVGEAEMVETYQRTKVFVSPSLLEGFGMPLLEAAACGAKIACSDLTVFREICGATATYFDPTNEHDIAAAIKVALASPSKDAMNVESFRWARIVRDLADTIEGAVNDGVVPSKEVELRD